MVSTTKLTDFLNNLHENPDSVGFNNVIDLIDKHYRFSPTAFSNGNQQNEAGQNNGSCKIYAFGRLHNLSEQLTLACFGEYYRNDVLKNPAAEDHQNIRQFMLNGWQGIVFEDTPLTPR